jgi:hypothetical protein
MRISEKLEVIEYLTPVSDNEILYRVEVMDSLAYTENSSLSALSRADPIMSRFMNLPMTKATIP